MAPYRVAVDTGGTFSDFVVFDEATERYRILKVPSTPDEPARAVLSGPDALAEQEVPPSAVHFFSHGTTVATNALLEERGARTGLAITAGFRGIYETMEQSRPFGPSIFALDYAKPRLLAPATRTVEIGERIGPSGEVRLALDESSVEQAIRLLEAEAVEAVANCFIFAFMNPEHERMEQAGGGSFGEPRSRPAEQVLRDVREGYVTPQAARAEYGVELTRDLTRDGHGWRVDEAETARLRGGCPC